MNKEHCIKSIKEFAQFGDNWDSYGSPSFNPELLKYACSIVENLREDTPEPCYNMIGGSAIPTGASTVQLEWRYKGKYLEIEITPESIVWLKDRAENSKIEDTESGEFFSNRKKKIDNLIKWLL